MRRFADEFKGRHLMIDGETFSTGSDCVFVQLAVGEFWPAERRTGRVWGAYIDLGSSLRARRQIDPDTILWWMDDNGAGMEARQALVAGLRSKMNPPVGWREALEEVQAFAVSAVGRGLGHRPEAPAGVWSHGAAFDIARLETAFKDQRMDVPWDFRNQCDTRMLFRMAGSKLSELAPPERTKHDAAADVQQQIAAVHAAFDVIDQEK